MLKKVLAILLSLVGVAIAAPAASPASTKTYDQRQEGDLNVKVDLDNFVILVARPVSSLDLFGTMAGLLASTDSRNTDIQISASSGSTSTHDGDGGGDTSGGGGTLASANSPDEQQQQLIIVKEEARTVDVKQEDNLENSAQMEDKKVDQVGDPQVGKVKVEEKVTGRGLEEVVRTLRNMKEKELRDKAVEGKSVGKYKFVGSVEESQGFKLVGDGVENCGPGRSRDSKGICQGDGRSSKD